MISLTSAQTVNIPTPLNLTGVILNSSSNNSQYLQGLTPQQVANLFVEQDPKAYNGTLAYNSSLNNYYPNDNPKSFINTSTGNNTYLKRDGSNANTDVNLGIYGLIANYVQSIGNSIYSDFYYGAGSEQLLAKTSSTTIQLGNDDGTITNLNFRTATGSMVVMSSAGVSINKVLTSTQDMLMGNGKNIILATTTGTKIANSSTQKLAFWGATPINQSRDTTAIDTLLTNTGLRASGGIGNFVSNVTTTDTFYSKGFAGLSGNYTIMKTAITTCNLNFTGGILTATNC
jgi:hypothetical protein